MYFREFNPEKPTSVLFIHGGGLGGWMWDQQVKDLKNFHCIVPHLPGHGGSRAIQHFSIKEAARQMARLIRSKGHGGKAHVVGHSIGAQILVQLLADSPEVVSTAVINSALVRSLWGMAGLIKPMVRLTIPLTRKQWFARVQAQTLSVPEEYFARYYEESRSISAQALEQLLAENATFKMPDGIKNIQLPTLVLVGQKERGIMLKSAKDLTDILPEAKGYMVQGVGHGFNFEAPELYNRVLQAWLSGGKLPADQLKEISR